MAVVHERSVSRDGCTRQAGFPHFVLHEVLEIFHAERVDSVRAYFESTLNNKEMYRITMHVKEDEDLMKMSLVHRTWTLPVQKALGRILYIGRPKLYQTPDLLYPVRKSIFCPWTSVVAVQLYHPIKKSSTTSMIGNILPLLLKGMNTASGSKLYIAFLSVSRISKASWSRAMPHTSPSGLIPRLENCFDGTCTWRRLPYTRQGTKGHLFLTL